MPILQQTYDNLLKKHWVVYAKKPFGKPQFVVEYLGRYSHKIAIFNHRIWALNKPQRQASFEERIERINLLIRGWINYFKPASIQAKLKKLEEWLRNR